MINLQDLIKTDVSRRQRGLRIRVGDFFMRGIEPVEILGKEDSKIRYTSLISGESKTVSHKEFTSLALSRIQYTGKMSNDFLKTVWGFAGARQTPIRARARIVKKMLSDAPSSEEYEKVSSWLFALSNEMEPVK